MTETARLHRLLYGPAIFLGAFLLFAVEPMAAKRLLPALGGSSAVWITCLVFFQSVLLLGYLYAHWLGRRPRVRQAVVIHFALLVLAAALLLLVSPPDLARASAHPLTAIFTALTSTIGLPFLLLASTSPLLQLWLARAEQGAFPWRLFALSNTGSLLALVLYPSVIEPHLSLPQQQASWGIGFGLYGTLVALIAWQTLRTSAAPGAPVAAAASGNARELRVSLRSRLLWFLLPAVAATQLCAVTEYLSQNIAAIPLLWVLPLGVYLVTFILAFEIPRLYRRWLSLRLLIVLLASLAWFLTKTEVSLPITVAIVFFLAELFLACLFCHAETYALRASGPSEATLFYLLIAAGGAAGTFFIGILCPLLFAANYDIAISFFFAAAAALIVVWPTGWQDRLLWSSSTAVTLAVVIMLQMAYARSVLEERNFYGALRVTESHYPPEAFAVRTLTHGTITHGMQWFAPEFRRTPTTYYAPDSGIGLALRNCCQGRPRNIGVIGLGAGTLAAYGQPGDHMQFYEINPAVLPIAQNLFTYLRESGAQLSFISGDARLSLASEPPQRLDVLAIDAFSGDAIPMHLLTTQAMQIYRRHLAPGGVLAFHVSNQFLDLAPEVAELAQSAGMQARLIETPSDNARGEFRALWVLVTDDQAFLDQPAIAQASTPIRSRPGLRAWTDDRSSLLPILRWQVLRPQ